MKKYIYSLMTIVTLIFVACGGGESTVVPEGKITFTSNATVTVEENQLSAIDVDAVSKENASLSYFIIGGADADSFTINFISGEVTFKNPPDFETKTSYHIIVSASDGTNDAVQDITINIKDVPDIVPVLNAFYGFVIETAAAGTQIGFIDINNTGDSPITAITLSGTGASNFTVSTAGAITVASGATLDYETTPVYNLIAIATNGAGDSISVTVTINLTNFSEFVPTLDPFTGSIGEDAAVEDIVGDITIVSTGDSPITVITLTGTGAANFAVNPAGTISVASGAVLDYETTPAYTLTATATNSAGSNSSPVTINITNVPETVPVLDVFSGSVSETAIAGTVVGNIPITSIGDTPITAITLSGTGASNFAVSTAGAITVASGAALDYETTPVYTLSAVATNGAGDSASVTVTINITDAAETVPTLDPFTGSIGEDAAAGDVVGDITIVSEGDSPITAITLTGTGSANFTVNTAGTISVASGAALDYETTTAYTLTATATNSAGDGTTSVTIDITNVAEIVPILDPFSGSVSETAAAGTVVGNIPIASNGDSPITAITLSGTGASNFAVSTAGTITVASGAALDYETTPVYSLGAVATNGAGDSASVTVTINVNNAAETVPTLDPFTGSIGEDAAAGDVVGDITIVSEGDSAITAINLTGTGSANFTVNTAGTISVASGAALDYETTTAYNLTAVATNSAGDGTTSVTIDITNVAETAPTLASSSGEVAENEPAGTTVGTVTITDEGDTPITAITLSGTGSGDFSVATDGTISVVNPPDFETTPLYSLTAVATNEAGDGNSVDVTITITDVVE
jgi:hypothetical protein